MILVEIEAKTGTIKRYECWARDKVLDLPAGVRLTHSGSCDKSTTFTQENVFQMRVHPPEMLRVQRDSRDLRESRDIYDPTPAA